jgi:predicted signal transduction protein with EAL and GGDEF domain
LGARVAGLITDKGKNMRQHLLEGFFRPSLRIKVSVAAIVLALLLLGALLVLQSGGTKFATLHVMYLPVCIAGLVFGFRGGVLTAIAAGLLVGAVPISTDTGETQMLHNWLYRTFVFCLVGGVVGGGADALRKQMSTLAWLNDHDVRSGMLGRTGLLKTLRRMISSREPGREMSVIVVNMSNFLEIQNTFGLDFGERLLTRISERWEQVVPAGMPIAMVQPDRLAAVFPSTDEVLRLRPGIEARMREPYLIGDVPVYVNFSIGAARCPTHADNAEELLQKASIAMHNATLGKQSYALYDIGSDRTCRENVILLGQVPEAIANREFCVWHQAKLSLPTRQLCGTEALVRWTHRQHGTVLPDAFIPQAEDTALINQLTHCIIDAVLADLAAWSAQGQAMDIAFNMSVQNLHCPALLAHLYDTTLALGLDPQRIEIEITESAVMSDFEVCRTQIARLRDQGYRVAVDDFGTGHASLSYLRMLPVTTLKIDRSFVKQLATSESDRKIVRAILDLARSFDLRTVAEGVEDLAALNLLCDWGCDYAQGFALHRPAPYADLMKWAEARG